MGNDARVAHRKRYINVMELLVAEEVDRQLAQLPQRVLKYIKRAEVETFALNRLPALYASSEKGLQCQYERAGRELKPQVQGAVRQAFAAVQVDPIRLSQPLQLHSQEEAVLEALRELLRSPDLTWESALHELRKLQRRRQGDHGGVARSPSANAADHRSTSAPSPKSPPPHSPAWRPGTYGSRISWKPKRQIYDPGKQFFEDFPSV